VEEKKDREKSTTNKHKGEKYIEKNIIRKSEHRGRKKDKVFGTECPNSWVEITYEKGKGRKIKGGKGGVWGQGKTRPARSKGPPNKKSSKP